MKKNILILFFLAISYIGNSQNCIKLLDSTVKKDLKKLSEIILGGFNIKDSVGVTPSSEEIIFQIKIVEHIVTEVIVFRDDNSLVPITSKAVATLIKQKWNPEGFISSNVVYPLKVFFVKKEAAAANERFFLSDFFEKNCEKSGVFFCSGASSVQFLQTKERMKIK